MQNSYFFARLYQHEQSYNTKVMQFLDQHDADLRRCHTLPDWSTGGGTDESTVVTVASPASFSTWTSL